ncbi:MAG: septum formation initiator family protein [Bryobacterales bacterium]|nr:septum formation initiator family protein [Bryobacterales bacterium]
MPKRPTIGLTELLLLVAGGVLFFALDVPGDMARYREQKRQLEQLRQRNAEEEREIRARQERLRRLTEDPEEQERYLRQQQKRVRPGEKVFVLPPDASR